MWAPSNTEDMDEFDVDATFEGCIDAHEYLWGVHICHGSQVLIFCQTQDHADC